MGFPIVLGRAIGNTKPNASIQLETSSLDLEIPSRILTNGCTASQRVSYRFLNVSEAQRTCPANDDALLIMPGLSNESCCLLPASPNSLACGDASRLASDQLCDECVLNGLAIANIEVVEAGIREMKGEE